VPNSTLRLYAPASQLASPRSGAALPLPDVWPPDPHSLGGSCGGTSRTTVRLLKGGLCVSTLYVAEQLLRAEGFTDIGYIEAHVGHVLVNTAVDQPWSQYFCCMLAGFPDYVRAYPNATRSVLRAVLKAYSARATVQTDSATRLAMAGSLRRVCVALSHQTGQLSNVRRRCHIDCNCIAHSGRQAIILMGREKIAVVVVNIGCVEHPVSGGRKHHLISMVLRAVLTETLQAIDRPA
jgi:hypothetical protein